jgi:hypothetical protein
MRLEVVVVNLAAEAHIGSIRARSPHVPAAPNAGAYSTRGIPPARRRAEHANASDVGGEIRVSEGLRQLERDACAHRDVEVPGASAAEQLRGGARHIFGRRNHDGGFDGQRPERSMHGAPVERNARNWCELPCVRKEPSLGQCIEDLPRENCICNAADHRWWR